MATLTAVAAGGKWGTAATWSPEQVPTAADDVVLASTSGSVTFTSPAACRSLEASAYTKTLTQQANLKIGTTTSNGGLCIKLGAGMTWTRTTGEVELVSTSGTVEGITLAGVLAEQAVQFAINPSSSSGKWQLEGAFNITFGLLLVKKGELKTNGNTVTVQGFRISGAESTVDLGASLIKLPATAGPQWSCESASTLVAGTSTIEITDTTVKAKTFAGGGKTYNIVTLSGNNIEVTGANTVATLKVNTARKTTTCKATLTAVSNHLVCTEGEANLEVGVEVTGVGIPTGTVILKKIEAKVWEMSANASETIVTPETVTIFPVGVLFKQGETQTVTGTFSTNGKATELARLATNESGKAATLKNGTGKAISVDWMRIKDIHATSTAAYAGANSTDVSGNEGWKYEAQPSQAVVLSTGARTNCQAVRVGVTLVTVWSGPRTISTAVKVAATAAAMSAGAQTVTAIQRAVRSTVSVVAGTQTVKTTVKVATSPIAQAAGAKTIAVAVKRAEGAVLTSTGARTSVQGVRIATTPITVTAGARTLSVAVKITVGTVSLRSGVRGTLAGAKLATGAVAQGTGGRIGLYTHQILNVTVRLSTGGRTMNVGARVVTGTTHLWAGVTLSSTGIARTLPATMRPTFLVLTELSTSISLTGNSTSAILAGNSTSVTIKPLKTLAYLRP